MSATVAGVPEREYHFDMEKARPDRPQRRDAWERAGLANEEGSLDHRQEPAAWLRPSNATLNTVRALQFEWDSTSTKIVRTPQDLLDRFLRLHDHHGVHAYGSRWGPLELCEHGIPYTHNPPSLPRGATIPSNATTLEEQLSAFERASEGCWPLLAEPVAMWLDLVERFAATLDVAVCLYHDKPGRLDDWERALPGGRSLLRGLQPGEYLTTDRLLLGELATYWLDLATVRPRFRWGPRQAVPAFDLVPDRLFSALVVRLVSAIGRTDGIARCTACGGFYVPLRRPTRGRRRYCEACRDEGKPRRDAERDYVMRNKRRKGSSR
jgi:hypothetical protein